MCGELPRIQYMSQCKAYIHDQSQGRMCVCVCVDSQIVAVDVQYLLYIGSRWPYC